MKYIIVILFCFIACTNQKIRQTDKLEKYGLETKVFNQYPTYYGGRYYEGNKVIVLIVKGSVNYDKKVLDNIIDVSNYIVKPCKFSYNDILKVHHIVTEFFLNTDNQNIIDEISIESIGIKEQKNTVFVRLRECTPGKIALFKSKIIDSPIISFEKWNGPIIAH